MVWIQTDDARRTLERLKGELSARELASAQSMAINKTLQLSRTKARAAVKQVYNISQNRLKGVNYMPAYPSASVIKGTLYAGRKPIPLDAFSPKQVTSGGSIKITKRGKQVVKQFKRLKTNPVVGVQIEIKKGEKEVLPYAFMIAGGAVRVFARGEYKTGTQHGFTLRHQRVSNDGNDLPIKPLITVSEFAQVINEHVVGKKGRLGPIAVFAHKKQGDELERILLMKLDKVAAGGG